MSDHELVLKVGSLAEIGGLLRRRHISVRELVRWYLARIERDNHAGRLINAVRVVSHHALDEASRLDDELERGLVRGPLHGIPIIIKDNILVGDGLTCCAGAKAFDGFGPKITATLAARLRTAGAVILGKANMTEFADYL